MKKAIKTIENSFYNTSHTCVVCGNEINSSVANGICDACFNVLPFNTGKVCTKCGTSMQSDSSVCTNCKNKHYSFEYARSTFVYKDAIKRLISKFKFKNNRYIATIVAPLMANTFHASSMKADVILPVPMHWWRAFVRGFNQSELLAKEISKLLNIPLLTNCLKKVRHTKPQTKLSKNKRDENLSNAFKVVNANLLKGKKILLIDDVYTTGSTAEHCSYALLQADVNSVRVLTLASADVFKAENSTKKPA